VQHRRFSVLSALDAQSEKILCKLLAEADVRIDGARPHDLVVHDRRFYTRVLRDGSLGLGEAYMDGQFDCEALDVAVSKVLAARVEQKVRANWSRILHVLKARALNLQSPLRAFRVGEQHYDLGNHLYERMLDPRMVYTCGYWRGAKDLAAAQEAKLDLVCRKLELEPGMKVLELGCGWGSFAKFAAERYGVEVTGYTVSREQVELGMKRSRGLPVVLRLADYREAIGTYDRVVSIGIMEHIGYKNYRSYFEVVDRCLATDGFALVHTIGGNLSSRTIEEWFHKYIFPNALLPSLAQIAEASEGPFAIEDVHNFGPHYDRTLMAWYDNFEAAWPELRDKYGDRFYRMWRYYLLASAGGFRARYQQLYQVVFSRTGRPQPSCRVS
jgi:cyclopropane-fatty-acyl-phospholipid synthase